MTTTKVIKIFGERNTGTNYVSKLLAQNFPVDQLRGVARQPKVNRYRREIIKFFGGDGFNQPFLERAADRYFQENFAQTLGWKHSRIDPEDIRQHGPDGLQILALTKNPYSWLLSMHKRPYQNGNAPSAFEDFLKADFPIHGRDNLPTNRLNPVEIWNQKTRSYFDLAAQADNVTILKYEDLLRDEMGAMDALATSWGLPQVNAVQSVDASTKGDKLSYNDYQDYYLSEKWRAKLSADDVATVNAALDHDLVKRAGYELIASA